jgi:hypothetical protein
LGNRKTPRRVDFYVSCAYTAHSHTKKVFMEQMLESLVDTISIYGVGVHMIVAVFFAIHAMRRGQ